jgi:hypothetical protein
MVASDQCSLGELLFEALTGVGPYAGEAADLRRRWVDAVPPRAAVLNPMLAHSQVQLVDGDELCLGEARIRVYIGSQSYGD